jgi:phosphoserine phosphatase
MTLMDWNSEIKIAIDKLLHTEAKEKIAVFDADGTLWHGDLGEAFFKHQANEGLAPGLKGIADPWAHYKKMCETDASSSFGWLAQINAGLTDHELHAQSEAFYRKSFSHKLDSRVKDLILNLQKASFEIWICSASIKWALAPCLKDLNIKLENLIAVEVELDPKNILTQKLITPLPYRPGKKYWIEKKLRAKPLLVAGNSMGDLEMMGLATELPLTIIFKPHLPEIQVSEEGMIIEATNRSWPVQIFES